jgi:hypothetical protein
MARNTSPSFTDVEELLRKYMPNELRERKETHSGDDEPGDWGAEIVRDAMRKMSENEPGSGSRKGKEKGR